ncbi:MAG: glycosyltransferase family 2 protein [Lachnospiraceae bacterium]|nr:glycosyltransferase family 2 protein [Lachnospiraceae bacterium]
MNRVSVVVPNYNGIAYMTDCLQALERQSFSDFTTIVVDNGSADGSAELVEQQFPWAQLIRMGENTGFCGAVNAGIQASEGMDFVILLNNDTKVDVRFVEEMLRAAKKSDKIFACQAKMIRMDDHSRLDDAGDYYCALGWAFARGKNKDVDAYDRSCSIFSACAGAAIYRKSILDEIGYFDENHFAYLEDTDICYRAKVHGYRNVYAPKAHVYHVGSGSSGSVYNLFKTKYSSRNSIYLIYKNMPILQILLNLPLLIPGFLAKAIFFLKKGYGKEYILGIGRGFVLSAKGKKEGKKVPFRMKNVGNYAKIQIELWVNTIRRFT